jgi:hypothetical protein
MPSVVDNGLYEQLEAVQREISAGHNTSPVTGRWLCQITRLCGRTQSASRGGCKRRILQNARTVANWWNSNAESVLNAVRKYPNSAQWQLPLWVR